MATPPNREEPPADQPHLIRRKAADEDDADQSPFHPRDQFSAERRGVGDDVGDPGRVEPYGAVESDLANFHLDEEIWVCTSCGFQTAAPSRPEGCPNCAAQDEFFAQEM